MLLTSKLATILCTAIPGLLHVKLRQFFLTSIVLFILKQTNKQRSTALHLVTPFLDGLSTSHRWGWAHTFPNRVPPPKYHLDFTEAWGSCPPDTSSWYELSCRWQRRHEACWKVGKVWRLAGGDTPHVAMSGPCGFRGLGSFGHSACRYCTVAGHYSGSPQPAARTESSASGSCPDPA